MSEVFVAASKKCLQCSLPQVIISVIIIVFSVIKRNRRFERPRKWPKDLKTRVPELQKCIENAIGLRIHQHDTALVE